jgi:hypothetical protein
LEELMRSYLSMKIQMEMELSYCYIFSEFSLLEYLYNHRLNPSISISTYQEMLPDRDVIWQTW